MKNNQNLNRIKISIPSKNKKLSKIKYVACHNPQSRSYLKLTTQPANVLLRVFSISKESLLNIYNQR